MPRCRLDRVDRQLQAAPNHHFDGTAEGGIRGRRHHFQHAIDRLARELGDLRGKALSFEQRESPLCNACSWRGENGLSAVTENEGLGAVRSALRVSPSHC